MCEWPSVHAWIARRIRKHEAHPGPGSGWMVQHRKLEKGGAADLLKLGTDDPRSRSLGEDPRALGNFDVASKRHGHQSSTAGAPPSLTNSRRALATFLASRLFGQPDGQTIARVPSRKIAWCPRARTRPRGIRLPRAAIECEVNGTTDSQPHELGSSTILRGSDLL